MIATIIATLVMGTGIANAAWEDKLLPDFPHTSFWSDITKGGEKEVRYGVLIVTAKKAGLGESVKALISYSILSSMVVQPLKKEVGRFRPDEAPGTGDRSSFPSGHSASVGWGAYWMTKNYPDQKWIWIGGTTLVGISRTQLRVHYPSDVLAGGIIGYFGSAILDHALDKVWEKIAKKDYNVVIIPEVGPDNLGIKVAWQF